MMRISVFLLPNSMPLTLHLSLLVASALLLFLCSTTSCLASQYQDCDYYKFQCGNFFFGYPFGRNGSGCGDPEFQLLDCDDHSGHPMLNIGGEKYRILNYLLFDHHMTIVNNNLFVSKCNVSGNYSQLWSPGSHFFISDDAYTNLTLSRQCHKRKKEMSQLKRLPLCGEDWYYNIRRPEDGTHFCQTHQQIPIKTNYLYPEFTVNQSKEGFEITWWVDQDMYHCCGACRESGGRCGYNISAQFVCYCPHGTTYPATCPPHPHDDGKPSASKEGRKNRSAIVIGCSVGGTALTAIALVLFLMYYAKGRSPSRSQGRATDSSKNERKDMGACAPRLKIGNLSIFSYEELRRATNCFHEENEIGDGGFGSVYLGKLRDEQTVAVKRLYQDGSRTVAQFINEVAIFSSLNHPHLVRLYGCTTAESPELLLVYEFVPNGNLENHLHGDRKGPGGLSWNNRLNIALQTAQALAFLHNFNPPIFHRDVKSSNILLEENLDIKLADFGLCRLVPVDASHVTTIPQGTPGYVDPEYYQCYQLTEKSDVYSFGVVLVEIISAKIAMDINRNRREINLANLAITKIQEGALDELVDPLLEIEVNHEVKVMVSAVAELAVRCLASERDDRPQMEEIVVQLENIRDSYGAWTGAGEQQQLGSSSNINQSNTVPFSPISVQDRWPSISSTYEDPPHKCINFSS